MPRRGVFRGLHSVLLDDPDYQRLPTAARCLLMTLRLCREAGPGVIFEYATDRLMRQTGLGPRALETAFQALEAGQWITRDGPIVWVRNGLRYDPLLTLANPKHTKSVLQSLATLPKRPIVVSFCDYYHLPYPFDSLSVPYANQGEGSREKGEGITTLQGENPPCPAPEHSQPHFTPQNLVDLYNAETPDECPSVRTLSAKRLENAKKLLHQFPDPAWWLDTFRQIHRSKFLRGLVPATPGHDRPFVADLDWLLSNGKHGTENAVLVHDGRYSRGSR